MNKAQQATLARILNTTLNRLDDDEPVGEVFDRLVTKIVEFLAYVEPTFNHTRFLDMVYFGKDKTQ